MSRQNHRLSARRLFCEPLESRCLLSALAGSDDFHAVIVAGDPNGSPADSPTARVDANTTTSPFAGVGSLQINANRGTYICTATPISSTHVVSAGHCLDLNGDGKSDKKDGIKSVSFNLNYGGNLTHKLTAQSWTLNPNYTGFNRPSVNDDLSVIKLGAPLPNGVPTYALPTADLDAGTTLTMVGYGRSGTGVDGYTVEANFAVKRVGYNSADSFYGQDDGGQAVNEVFRFDFDGPTGVGSLGGPTLGNNKETTLGGGDSGGPSFVPNGSGYTLVGVNTFTQGTNAPKFGSLGGGINVFPYVGWINSVMSGALGTGGGGGGPGNGAGGQFGAGFSAIDAEILVDSSVGSDAGAIEFADSQINVGATVSSGTSAVRSTGSVDTRQELDQPGWFLNHVTPGAGTTKRLLDSASSDGTNSGEQDTADDLVPAVDEILSRWAL